jgi:hypothetical protein
VWVGPPRILLSSAKVDALVHAASCGCGAAIPLTQPETVTVPVPPDELAVRCPAGCGAKISVPLVMVDTLSAGSDDGERRVPFTAEAPELHESVNRHLRRCLSVPVSVDADLERARY